MSEKKEELDLPLEEKDADMVKRDFIDIVKGILYGSLFILIIYLGSLFI